MKYKKGFVTNSSTTVYICDVCGQDVAGMDIGLDEAQMIQCVKGHTFCTDHQEIPPIDTDDDNDEFDPYEADQKYCPICTLNVIKDEDMVKYLIKSADIKYDVVVQHIRDQFNSYEDFSQFIKD